MNRDVAPLTVSAEDAIELAELLEFLHDWTRWAGESLHAYSLGIYTLDDLRGDLARFAFLLGGTSHLLLNDEEDR